ncbi:MAG: response regulator, partial [Candidatus Sericytochromatia bacterium]
SLIWFFVIMEKNIKPIIAIVEDESSLLKVMENIFKKDYELILCQNGAEAINLIKEKRPDLIISDVMMPIMDGFELKYELNKEDYLKKIPFILITALSEQDIRGKLDKLDVEITLSKPIRIKEIKELVRDILDSIQTFS